MEMRSDLCQNTNNEEGNHMKDPNQVLAASDTANSGVDEVEKSGILLPLAGR